MSGPRPPLAFAASLKVKLGVLVAASVAVAAIIGTVGAAGGVAPWLAIPVTIALALAVTQLLAVGMTAPLREMTDAARRMARGDYDVRVSAPSRDEVGQLADRLSVRPPRGDDPVERVNDVLRRANRVLNRQPDVTVAMIRALVAGNPDVAPVVSQVRASMRRIISDALEVEGDVVAIDLLTDVWLAALVSWITGVATADRVVERLEEATGVLLG